MGTRIRENLLRLGMKLLCRFDRRHPDPALLGTSAIQRILAVSSTAIGDALLSTPALRSLRLAYPKARISLLLNVAYTDLLASNPDIDEIIPYYGGYRRFWRLTWQLKQKHFDLVAILHGNEPQATPLAYLSGAPFRYKLPNDNQFRFLLTNREPIYRWEDFQHGIDQRLAVAKLAGGAPTDRRMTLPVRPEDRAAVAERLQAQGIADTSVLVGLQTGASTVSRRWSPERFAELGRRLLAERPGVHLVLTGSPGERLLAAEVARLIDSPRVWNAAGQFPLGLLPALFSRLATLVTGDTGPMHLAVAVGTPVVALFAVSDWRRSGPASDLDKHVVIQKWRTCDPCLSKRCPYARPLCMANISVDEVATAVNGRLEGLPGSVTEEKGAPI